MDMTRHTPSLRTCQNLKEAGFPQETKHGWWKWADGDTGVFELVEHWIGYEPEDKPELACAAPLLTELLEQLPEKIRGFDEYRTLVIKKFRDVTVIGYADPNHSIEATMLYQFHNPNPSEAAARLWLWLKSQ